MLTYRSLATRLFSGMVDKNIKLFESVREQLPRANIRIPVRIYMSIAILTSLLVGVVSTAMVFLASRFYDIGLSTILVGAVFLPISAAVGSFVIFIFYPSQRAKSRRRNIETNLPFVLTHMGAIAESGVPPYTIFKLIAEFEDYGEISKEMRKIVQNIENFGINPLRAVKEVAERTPSPEFRQALMGFVTTTESGGDIKVYLKSTGNQALFDWRIKRQRFLQQLSAYAEFYTGIFIAAPLFIIALFSVMSMINPEMAGFDILFLTQASVYFLIPILNIGFLLFLKGTEVEM